MDDGMCRDERCIASFLPLLIVVCKCMLLRLRSPGFEGPEESLSERRKNWNYALYGLFAQLFDGFLWRLGNAF